MYLEKMIGLHLNRKNLFTPKGKEKRVAHPQPAPKKGMEFGQYKFEIEIKKKRL